MPHLKSRGKAVVANCENVAVGRMPIATAVDVEPGLATWWRPVAGKNQRRRTNLVNDLKYRNSAVSRVFTCGLQKNCNKTMHSGVNKEHANAKGMLESPAISFMSGRPPCRALLKLLFKKFRHSYSPSIFPTNEQKRFGFNSGKNGCNAGAGLSASRSFAGKSGILAGEEFFSYNKRLLECEKERKQYQTENCSGRLVINSKRRIKRCVTNSNEWFLNSFDRLIPRQGGHYRSTRLRLLGPFLQPRRLHLSFPPFKRLPTNSNTESNRFYSSAGVSTGNIGSLKNDLGTWKSSQNFGVKEDKNVFLGEQFDCHTKDTCEWRKKIKLVCDFKSENFNEDSLCGNNILSEGGKENYHITELLSELADHDGNTDEVVFLRNCGEFAHHLPIFMNKSVIQGQSTKYKTLNLSLDRSTGKGEHNDSINLSKYENDDDIQICVDDTWHLKEESSKRGKFIDFDRLTIGSRVRKIRLKLDVRRRSSCPPICYIYTKNKYLLSPRKRSRSVSFIRHNCGSVDCLSCDELKGDMRNYLNYTGRIIDSIYGEKFSSAFDGNRTDPIPALASALGLSSNTLKSPENRTNLSRIIREEGIQGQDRSISILERNKIPCLFECSDKTIVGRNDADTNESKTVDIVAAINSPPPSDEIKDQNDVNAGLPDVKRIENILPLSEQNTRDSTYNSVDTTTENGGNEFSVGNSICIWDELMDEDLECFPKAGMEEVTGLSSSALGQGEEVRNDILDKKTLKCKFETDKLDRFKLGLPGERKSDVNSGSSQSGCQPTSRSRNLLELPERRELERQRYILQKLQKQIEGEETQVQQKQTMKASRRSVDKERLQRLYEDAAAREKRISALRILKQQEEDLCIELETRKFKPRPAPKFVRNRKLLSSGSANEIANNRISSVPFCGLPLATGDKNSIVTENMGQFGYYSIAGMPSREGNSATENAIRPRNPSYVQTKQTTKEISSTSFMTSAAKDDEVSLRYKTNMCNNTQILRENGENIQLHINVTKSRSPLDINIGEDEKEYFRDSEKFEVLEKTNQILKTTKQSRKTANKTLSPLENKPYKFIHSDNSINSNEGHRNDQGDIVVENMTEISHEGEKPHDASPKVCLSGSAHVIGELAQTWDFECYSSSSANAVEQKKLEMKPSGKCEFRLSNPTVSSKLYKHDPVINHDIDSHKSCSSCCTQHNEKFTNTQHKRMTDEEYLCKGLHSKSQRKIDENLTGSRRSAKGRHRFDSIEKQFSYKLLKAVKGSRAAKEIMTRKRQEQQSRKSENSTCTCGSDLRRCGVTHGSGNSYILNSKGSHAENSLKFSTVSTFSYASNTNSVKYMTEGTKERGINQRMRGDTKDMNLKIIDKTQALEQIYKIVGTCDHANHQCAQETGGGTNISATHNSERRTLKNNSCHGKVFKSKKDQNVDSFQLTSRSPIGKETNSMSKTTIKKDLYKENFCMEPKIENVSACRRSNGTMYQQLKNKTLGREVTPEERRKPSNTNARFGSISPVNHGYGNKGMSLQNFKNKRDNKKNPFQSDATDRLPTPVKSKNQNDYHNSEAKDISEKDLFLQGLKCRKCLGMEDICVQTGAKEVLLPGSRTSREKRIEEKEKMDEVIDLARSLFDSHWTNTTAELTFGHQGDVKKFSGSAQSCRNNSKYNYPVVDCMYTLATQASQSTTLRTENTGNQDIPHQPYLNSHSAHIHRLKSMQSDHLYTAYFNDNGKNSKTHSPEIYQYGKKHPPMQVRHNYELIKQWKLHTRRHNDSRPSVNEENFQTFSQHDDQYAYPHEMYVHMEDLALENNEVMQECDFIPDERGLSLNLRYLSTDQQQFLGPCSSEEERQKGRNALNIWAQKQILWESERLQRRLIHLRREAEARYYVKPYISESKLKNLKAENYNPKPKIDGRTSGHAEDCFMSGASVLEEQNHNHIQQVLLNSRNQNKRPVISCAYDECQGNERKTIKGSRTINNHNSPRFGAPIYGSILE